MSLGRQILLATVFFCVSCVLLVCCRLHRGDAGLCVYTHSAPLAHKDSIVDCNTPRGMQEASATTVFVDQNLSK